MHKHSNLKDTYIFDCFPIVYFNVRKDKHCIIEPITSSFTDRLLFYAQHPYLKFLIFQMASRPPITILSLRAATLMMHLVAYYTDHNMVQYFCCYNPPLLIGLEEMCCCSPSDKYVARFLVSFTHGSDS